MKAQLQDSSCRPQKTLNYIAGALNDHKQIRTRTFLSNAEKYKEFAVDYPQRPQHLKIIIAALLAVELHKAGRAS